MFECVVPGLYSDKYSQYLLRFLAEDQNSGRREYLISRERQLDVTDLTLASVRTTDPRLVSISGITLQGHHPGSADIQVSREKSQLKG